MTGAIVRLAATAILRLDDERRLATIARLATEHDIASLRLHVDDQDPMNELRARAALKAFSQKDVARALERLLSRRPLAPAASSFG